MEFAVMVPCAHMSVHAEISLITAACGCVGCGSREGHRHLLLTLIASLLCFSHRMMVWGYRQPLGEHRPLVPEQGGHAEVVSGLGKELEEGMCQVQKVSTRSCHGQADAH